MITLFEYVTGRKERVKITLYKFEKKIIFKLIGYVDNFFKTFIRNQLNIFALLFNS